MNVYRGRTAILPLPLLVMFCACVFSFAQTEKELEKDLRQIMADLKIPGLSVAVLARGHLLYMGSFGFANLESQQPMTPDTVLNIGSVSKLITATALMLLVEQGKIDLDKEVSVYLPFSVTHPSGKAITARRLLTHTAGILDGDAYAASYACGDPTVSLQAWLRGYLLPDGAYYDASHFSKWEPGTAYQYSNVGYGVIGLMVEHVAQMPFASFTKKYIQEPLGMHHSGWYLADIDPKQHATPYWLEVAGEPVDPTDAKLLPPGARTPGQLVPFCSYSFYNYPDGLYRTSMKDLVKFANATVPNPTGTPLLTATTRAAIFQDQLAQTPSIKEKHGLGWSYTESRSFGHFWGHGGADPGVTARVLYRQDGDLTLIFFANRLEGKAHRPILEALFRYAERVAPK